MTGFLLRWMISALGLWVAQAVVPGVTIENTTTLLLAGLVLGFLNAVVRPVLVFFTLPLTVLTLGLFLIVINALMLELVAWLLQGVSLAGFGSALLGALVVSIVSTFASWTLGPTGRVEVMVVRRD